MGLASYDSVREELGQVNVTQRREDKILNQECPTLCEKQKRKAWATHRGLSFSS